MGPNQKELARMENISMEFPGVKALDGVSFNVLEGEIHALVGENGAGKSTLIKVLMGVYTPTTGTLYINGKQARYRGPADAIAQGLGAVYQDITMAAHLTVGENFFLGHLPVKGGKVDWKRIFADSQATLDDLKINIDSRTLVRDLTIGQQEMVSIAKIIHQKANVIVFDEPTALLTNEEVEILFNLIGDLKKRGFGIIYISHRMEEIFQLCDRVTILKNGERQRDEREGTGEPDGRPFRRGYVWNQARATGRCEAGSAQSHGSAVQGYILPGAQGRDLRHVRLDRRGAHGDLPRHLRR